MNSAHGGTSGTSSTAFIVKGCRRNQYHKLWAPEVLGKLYIFCAHGTTTGSRASSQIVIDIISIGIEVNILIWIPVQQSKSSMVCVLVIRSSGKCRTSNKSCLASELCRLAS